MIGQPADSKNDHHHHHGLHKLGEQKKNPRGYSWALGAGLAGEVLVSLWGWFALPKCRVWNVDPDCRDKETSPGDETWEQGGSALVMGTGTGKECPGDGNRAGVKANASGCRGAACSCAREMCRETRLLHSVQSFILRWVDSLDTRLYSLKAAGSQPAAVSLSSLEGWLVHATTIFFKLAG